MILKGVPDAWRLYRVADGKAYWDGGIGRALTSPARGSRLCLRRGQGPVDEGGRVAGTAFKILDNNLEITTGHVSIGTMPGPPCAAPTWFEIFRPCSGDRGG